MYVHICIGRWRSVRVCAWHLKCVLFVCNMWTCASSVLVNLSIGSLLFGQLSILWKPISCIEVHDQKDHCIDFLLLFFAISIEMGSSRGNANLKRNFRKYQYHRYRWCLRMSSDGRNSEILIWMVSNALANVHSLHAFCASPERIII